MKPNQAVIVAMHLLGLRLTSLLEIITIKDVDINSRTILYKYNGTRGLLFKTGAPSSVQNREMKDDFMISRNLE